MLYDVDDAVDEVVAIREAGLTGGVLLPMDGTEGGVEPLHCPEYEPLWAMCEDLEVPVHRHASEPSTSPEPDRPELIAIGMAEYGFWNHRGLAHLVFSGVFERHPRLRFVFAETGIHWVPGHLQELDGVYGMGKSDRDGTLRGVMREAVAPLRLAPSEYFRQNCYIGASTLQPWEMADRHEVGVGRIMWGIDYPHAEGCFPFAREAMRLTFAGVPEPEVRAMLGETAAEVYGFDLEQLRPIADGVGPTVAEVAEPLTEVPRVPEDTYGAVFDGAVR
jgi:predicted TIM-barrel fold metal-dependent hydrolase